MLYTSTQRLFLWGLMAWGWALGALGKEEGGTPSDQGHEGEAPRASGPLNPEGQGLGLTWYLAFCKHSINS